MNPQVIAQLTPLILNLDDEALAALNFAIDHGWTKILGKWEPYVAEIKHVLEMSVKLTKLDFPNIFGEPPAAA